MSKYVLASLCSIAIIAAAVAADPQNQTQNPNQNQNQNQNQRANQPGINVQAPGVNVNVGQRGMHGDQALATCLAIANQEEIALAKLAEEKSKSKDVKEFAEMLVKDHQGFLQKLSKFAPEAAREGFLMERHQNQTRDNKSQSSTNQNSNIQPAGGAARADGQRDGQRVQQTAGTAQDPAHGGQHLDFIAMHKEIAEECLANAKAKMNREDADKFDKCFIGHQIGMHEQMKVTLTVFQRHTNGELNQVISEGLKKTESHLKKAEDIMKDLEASSGSRRDSDSKKS